MSLVVGFLVKIYTTEWYRNADLNCVTSAWWYQKSFYWLLIITLPPSINPTAFNCAMMLITLQWQRPSTVIAKLCCNYHSMLCEYFAGNLMISVDAVYQQPTMFAGQLPRYTFQCEVFKRLPRSIDYTCQLKLGCCNIPSQLILVVNYFQLTLLRLLTTRNLKSWKIIQVFNQIMFLSETKLLNMFTIEYILETCIY